MKLLILIHSKILILLPTEATLFDSKLKIKLDFTYEQWTVLRHLKCYKLNEFSYFKIYILNLRAIRIEIDYYLSFAWTIIVIIIIIQCSTHWLSEYLPGISLGWSNPELQFRASNRFINAHIQYTVYSCSIFCRKIFSNKYLFTIYSEP